MAFIVKKYLSILAKESNVIGFYNHPKESDVCIFENQLQAFEFLKTYLKIDDGFLMINANHQNVYKITLDHCDHFATITRVIPLEEMAMRTT